jgi:predicted  nucleic acid-binding Zn-ribbon protein
LRRQLMEAQARKEIRKRFDEAVAYQLAGDFVHAALCYQSVIDEIDDLHAKYVARYRLKWCISLEAIVEKMRLVRHPVSVTEMVNEACKADDELSRGSPDVVVQEIESQLSQLPICHRVGNKLWVLTDCFEECIREAIETLSQSPEPLPLREFLKQHWPEYAVKNKTFPDRIGIGALAAKLQQNKIEIVGQEYGISAACMTLKIQHFYELIREEGCPIEVEPCLHLLFPTLTLTPQNASAIKIFMRSHLDKRFIEVAPEVWFLREMLTFDTDMFDDVFDANPLPHSTDSLICRRLFPSTENIPSILRSFRQYVSTLLRRNPNLLEVGHEYWLSRSILPTLYQQAIAVLEASDQPVTASEVVTKGLLNAPADREQVAALTSLVEAKFRKTRQVFALLKGRWLHESAMTRVLDRVHTWLLQEQHPRSTVPMVLHAFDLLSAKSPSVKPLAEWLEECLHTDLRFLFDASADGWRAVPPGPSENLPAYHVLWGYRLPVSEDVLLEMVRDRFPTLHPDFNLADDNRFRAWRGDKWGLSQWIDINDWAYEYLREKNMALLPTTIVTKVCERHGVPADLAVFTPEDDPRFMPRPHGRWFYRYAVADADLDRMLALLRSADGGLTLDELVVQTVGLGANDTDASERMAQDERFVFVAGWWFAREKAFYPLTDEDMEQLLATLRREGTGLRLTTLVRRVLDRETHLTDAEARLRADSRFREILPGVWTAKDLQPPSEKRIPFFNRPIHSEKVSVIPEDEYTVMEDLTVRVSQPTGETASIQRRQITRTLSLLDVRHGNLLIDQAVASLMPSDDEPAVHFTDELGNEFTGWVDRGNNLLQGLGSWFETRRLTFGDKIVIKATDQDGFLEIQPKGQRDERVYQEALQRQDVEKLIQSAQQTRKSYHDLMIEVMDYFNQTAGVPVPLHREDIYNLVNYNRTASRSYIFSLLSLTDCPYEELRYFVPHGRGYWSFGLDRRRAFDMKMKQLLEKVEQLEAENKRLQQTVVSAKEGEVESGVEITKLMQQMREQDARIAELSTQNAQLLDTNQRLRAEKEDQLRRITELDTQVSALKAQATKQATELEALRSSHESLQKELADTQRERNELQDSQKRQARRIEELMQDKMTLAREFAALQTKVEQLTSHNTTLQENVDQLQDQVDTLTNEKTALQQRHEQAMATLEGLAESSGTRQRELQNELELERKRGHLEALERLSGMKDEEAAQLRAKIDQIRVALRTPLGRGFVTLLRVLSGPDLSDL